MTTIGKMGIIDRTAQVCGDWSDVNILTTTNILYNIGNVHDAVLEIMRTEYQHIGTAFPRIVDLVVPVQFGMRFAGQATELHSALYHALINDSLSLYSSNYIYAGAQTCNTFVTIQAMRRRACDAVIIEARLFKAFALGNISMGVGNNEFVKTGFDYQAVDDSDNTMGQGGSSSVPLGYLWVPSPSSAVTTSA